MSTPDTDATTSVTVEKPAKINVVWELLKDLFGAIRSDIDKVYWDSLAEKDRKDLLSQFEISEILYDEDGVPNKITMIRKR